MMSTVPSASRPSFSSSYGIHQDPEGMLDWSWADSRLAEAHNYWLCTTSASGAPHARPLWAVWMAGRLCFSTDADSIKARAIARDPRVCVHLESGDEVVILDGIAEPLPAELAAPLADAYRRKYDLEVSVGPTGWYAIRPRRAFAWTEAGYVETATRFDFE